jgi:hypothetical protein
MTAVDTRTPRWWRTEGDLDDLLRLIRAGESIILSARRCGWNRIQSVYDVAAKHGRTDVLEAIKPETAYSREQGRPSRTSRWGF